MRAAIKKFLNDVDAQAPKMWAWETIDDALTSELVVKLEGFDQPYPYALTEAGLAAIAIPQTFSWTATDVASDAHGSKILERCWKAPRLGPLSGVVVFDKMQGADRYEIYRAQSNGLGGKTLALVARVRTQKALRKALADLFH